MKCRLFCIESSFLQSGLGDGQAGSEAVCLHTGDAKSMVSGTGYARNPQLSV